MMRVYQNIIIESGARIFQKDKQLYVISNEEHHVPIEDISTLVLANQQISITAFSLEKLIENGTAVILCNDVHHPSGIVLPFAANSRRLKMIQTQISQTKPKLKRLWQQIIQRKILNQGKCLQISGNSDTVSGLASTVKSGDIGNVEGTAAARYFKVLFGAEFIRHEDTVINGILNYGYAILRSSIVRYLAIYGFEPCLGIFHHSELNAFNLADDLIEPFRPIVDLYANQYSGVDLENITPDIKHDLVQLLACNVKSGEEIHAVNYAIERTIHSLIRCYLGKENTLILPELIPLKIHSYE